MAMPTDLIFVRHGHSEGNRLLESFKNGNRDALGQDFREIPGHRWRLTDEGREQAEITGDWIGANISERFDRYFCSPFVRTRETAAYLGLPDAEWRIDQRLRERDWGEINSVPHSEHAALYPRNAQIQKIDALYWRPPGGESIADVGLRVRDLLDTFHRECAGQTVIVVTHGEFMSAARARLGYLSDEEWVQGDSDPSQKLFNTHVLHYSRRNPQTGEIEKYANWQRSICPWKEETDTGWTRVVRRRYTNEELLVQIAAFEPLVTCETNDLPVS